MANQRDIHRWKEGRDHWNEWAAELLERKKKLEQEGEWAVDEEGVGANEPTKEWIEIASVDFSKYVFEEEVDFSGFLFPHAAHFVDAKFKKFARFRGATFSGIAGFIRAAFSEEARFEKAVFSGNARFDRCEFDGIADFSGARFRGRASFNSARSDGPFSLAGACFRQVPDFVQTSFRAAVRLDELQIEPTRRFLFKGDRNKSARWRALKKLAIESHDHVRAQTFFANEVRECRGSDDKRSSDAFWLGLVYEATSDFGRSILLPFFWLVGFWVVFTFLYLFSIPLSAWPNCERAGQLAIVCAADLSLFNSLPFAGLAKAEQIKAISNCLYGAEALPRGVIRWTILQSVLSAAMIFLILLGIRNWFRIK